VHSGVTFVGNVGGEGVVDFTALGDTVNTTARLASAAAAGEVLLGEAVYAAVAERAPDLERRTLRLNRWDSSEAQFVILFRREGIRDAKALFA
jgi:adenylate cyclase